MTLMSDRYRCKQLVFFILLLALALFMLREAVQLNFSIRGTIGPAVYPAIVLVLLSFACLAAIGSMLWRREILILSPFVEGLRNDTILRGLIREMPAHAGMGARVFVRNGVGVFSALHTGLRGNGTLTVISSETPDMTAAEIAVAALEKFQPIGRLFYEPDALVVSAGQSNDLQQFWDATREKGHLRAAFTRVQSSAGPAETWLRSNSGAQLEGIYEQTSQQILDQLEAGNIDAAIMPLHEAADAGSARRVTIIVAFADEDADCFGLAPTSRDLGFPLTLGNWAGVAAQRGISLEEQERIHDLIAKSFDSYIHSNLRHDEDATWSIGAQEGFSTFLKNLAGERRSQGVALPSGRLAGFVVAVALILTFPLLMEVLGFPLAAFGFLASLMALLEPQLRLSTVVRIIILAGIFSAGLYFLFWHVFYVVFPDGLVWSLW